VGKGNLEEVLAILLVLAMMLLFQLVVMVLLSPLPCK
jgi:hypothetical protein